MLITFLSPGIAISVNIECSFFMITDLLLLLLLKYWYFSTVVIPFLFSLFLFLCIFTFFALHLFSVLALQLVSVLLSASH
jgi:hypothetical protein